jgi:alanine-glyoxylate transaminase / serine-glyoxylate transaminase / serine-pyruvate transaminase
MGEVDPRSLPDLPELMIAGPGELHNEDLAVLGHQVIAHYGDVWTELHRQTIADLSRLLGAADPPYLIPGTGTTCLDAGIGNLFEPGQRVLVAQTGFFGTRLSQIAAAHRLEVVEIPVEVGRAFDPARIADASKGAHGVLSTHVDTATGVRHPIDDIARVARDNDLIYFVDGIASVGGELCDVDGMGVDCVVTGSQKGLDAPPGLGILALGEGGRARVEARSEPPPTFYLDLKVWDRYRDEWGAWHPHPVTMPTNLVLALASSVRRILGEGIEAWVAGRADLAKRCREGLRGLGLEPVPEPGVEANLVVAMWADDPATIQKHLLNKGIMISGGLDPTMGRAIRVGLMGRTASQEMVDRVVEAVGEVLG